MTVRRRLLLLALLVFLGLAATTEERLVGTSTDDQQMLETSVAVAELGEVGLPRGGALAIDRPAGDAVAPYGMGLPLLEALPSLGAGALERWLGVGSSQSLYALLQVLLVTLAAVLAAALARSLGASAAGEGLAALGTAFGSPLWAYPSAAYSEPLQAVALAAGALLATGARSRRRDLASGFCLALAVLVKPSNLLLAPLLVVPHLLPADRPRRSRAAAMLVGALPPAAAWLAFDLARFGRPFASYGGQAFSFPPLEGLWRLLVGPSKGLLVYFPLAALAVLAILRWRRRGPFPAAGLGIAIFTCGLVGLTCAWWAWDGTVGWGPRLLVPAIPLLAALAATTVTSRATTLAAALLLSAGVAVNVLGALQPESATNAYLAATAPVQLSAEEAGRLPAYYVAPDRDGFRINRNLVAARDDVLSPIRLHAFFLRARLAPSRTEVDRRLATPPWADARPGAVVAPGRAPGFLREPFRWPHLGSTWTAAGRREGRAAWYQAMVAQAYRALDLGLHTRALSLTAELHALDATGFSAALRAEALRATGDLGGLESFRSQLPPAQRDTIAMGIVSALAARDRGDEPAARALLSRVAEKAPREPIRKALASPLAAWPRGLRGMLAEPRPGRVVALPGAGS